MSVPIPTIDLPASFPNSQFSLNVLQTKALLSNKLNQFNRSAQSSRIAKISLYVSEGLEPKKLRNARKSAFCITLQQIIVDLDQLIQILDQYFPSTDESLELNVTEEMLCFILAYCSPRNFPASCF